MTDTFSRTDRSRIMAAVRSTGTAPELLVEDVLRALRLRFRKHVRTLPGTPDFVFLSLRKVINVSGCFWHGHGCKRCRIPQANRKYWLGKIEGNRLRDVRTNRRL